MIRNRARHVVQVLVRAVYSRGVRPTWNAGAKPLRAPLLPAARGQAVGGRLTDTGSLPSALSELRQAGAEAHLQRLIADFERSLPWHGRLLWRLAGWYTRRRTQCRN
jgi:hypothetical protein